MTIVILEPTWSAGRTPDTLEVDGRPVAPVWVTQGREEVNRGLLGTDGLEGSVLLRKCPSVHTFGMRYLIDVAFLTKDGRVLTTRTMKPRRLSRFHWRAADTVEAPAGAFATWGLQRGSRLSVRAS